MAEKRDQEQEPRANEEVRTGLPPGVKLLRTLEGHQGAVKSVAFDPQGVTLASGKAVVTPEELRDRLEATDATWRFTDAEMLTAVGHLENYGYVKRLRTSKGEQRILLQPERLNNLASSFVLEARRKKPPEEEAATEDGVAYTVSGPTENVFASLVVLLGYTHTFTRTTQWQNNARYEMGDGLMCGFRQEAERDGELDFVLCFGPKVGLPVRTLFQGLFESFLGRRNGAAL